VAVKKSRFLESIERSRAAASQPARPEEKPVDEMSADELAEAHRVALIRSTEAQRAVVAAAAEYTRPPTTLAANLRELQRGKKNHWR
jgi:hypothetical protein